MITTVKLNKQTFDSLIEWSRQCSPEEACGIFFGSIQNDVADVKLFANITNSDHDPMHFTMDVKEQMAVIKRFRREGLKMLAVVHSHPNGPDRMTKEDLRLAMDPEVVWVIVSYLDRDVPDIKSFTVSEGCATELVTLLSFSDTE